MKKADKKTYIAFTIVILVVFLSAFASVYYKRANIFKYSKHTEDTVAIFDGEEIPLKELSYYIMVEEEVVQETAIEYDPANPKAYWNLYIDTCFVCEEAKDTVLSYYLRDRIYADMALGEGLSISEDKESELIDKASNIYQDLIAGDNNLALTEEDILASLRQNELSNIWMLYMSDQDGITLTEEVLSANYGINSLYYKERLKEHDLKLKDSLYDKIILGTITVNCN